MIDPTKIASILDGLPPSVRPLSTGLDHLGIAVSSLEAALALYSELLGLETHGTELRTAEPAATSTLKGVGGLVIENAFLTGTFG